MEHSIYHTLTDIDRIINYLHEEMGIVTTAENMSVATTNGIVNFGMIGYSIRDSLLIVVSPDNLTLKDSTIDNLLECVELAKRHFRLFTPNHIYGVIVCEQVSEPALQYAAEKQITTVLKISEESIVKVLSAYLKPNQLIDK